MSLVPTRPSRRTFLKQSAALSGVFVLGIQGTNAVAADAAEVTHWVVIAPDDTVTIRIARSELGQGTFTGLAQLVAEELGCEWSKVRAEYADVNEHIRRNKIWKSPLERCNQLIPRWFWRNLQFGRSEGPGFLQAKLQKMERPAAGVFCFKCRHGRRQFRSITPSSHHSCQVFYHLGSIAWLC
nr:twin-arginine translocation signal domain-containing protein [Oxalobacteraceae bacterium]